jgi:hypothetical protein
MGMAVFGLEQLGRLRGGQSWLNFSLVSLAHHESQCRDREPDNWEYWRSKERQG